MDNLRVCTICKIGKEEDLFTNKARIKNTGQCKNCERERSKQSKRKGRSSKEGVERDRENSRRYRLRNKLKVAEAEKRWELRNPHKKQAVNKAAWARHIGKIVKEPCIVCKISFNKINMNVHGHHVDYAKPTLLVWLCPKHHKMVHVRIKERSDAKELSNINHIGNSIS